MTLAEQLGNIGSEVGRAVNWERKNNKEKRESALDRAFELLYLTIEDPKQKNRLKEICRAREILADTFYGNREYGYAPEDLERYFFQYAVAARRRI